MLKAFASEWNLPLGFAVICSGCAVGRGEELEWLLISRSSFDAVLLTGAVTLAIENPRAASCGHVEMVKQAARARQPITATRLNGKNAVFA